VDEGVGQHERLADDAIGADVVLDAVAQPLLAFRDGLLAKRPRKRKARLAEGRPSAVGCSSRCDLTMAPQWGRSRSVEANNSAATMRRPCDTTRPHWPGSGPIVTSSSTVLRRPGSRSMNASASAMAPLEESTPMRCSSCSTTCQTAPWSAWRSEECAPTVARRWATASCLMRRTRRGAITSPYWNARRAPQRPCSRQVTGIFRVAPAGTSTLTLRVRFWAPPTRLSPSMSRIARSVGLVTERVGTEALGNSSTTSPEPGPVAMGGRLAGGR